DRKPKFCGEPVEIDLKPTMAGDVEHVECEDHRPADLLQLKHEPQSEPQIRRIGDADEEAWDILTVKPTENDVAGDGLVQAAGAQRVGPRKIDEPHGDARRRYR